MSETLHNNFECMWEDEKIQKGLKVPYDEEQKVDMQCVGTPGTCKQHAS